MNSNPHRRAVAFHEAGHCLLAWMHAKPGSVRAVLMSPEKGACGFTWYDMTGAAPWQRYAVSIGGPLAMAIHASENGFGITKEPSGIDLGDTGARLRQTLEDAGAVGLNDDREPVYTPESLAVIEAGRPRSIEAQTLRLLRQHWPAVEAVAKVLEGHGRIGPRQLTQIMRRHGVERARA